MALVKVSRAVIAVLISCWFIASASAATITFDLNDHPDGNQTPPHEYGLRLDGEGKFFSFDSGATVQMMVDTIAMTAVISGTVVENDATNDNLGFWDLNFAFTGVVIEGANGAFTSTGGSGTVADQDSAASHALTSKVNGAGIAMIFRDETFRGFTGWNGRGWIEGGGTNDFLFTATVVPLPAAFPLFGTGLGILGFLGWRRRRQAQAV